MADLLFPIMQFCADGATMADHLQNTDFFKAAACPFVSRTGLALTAMIVYGAVAIPIQLRTGSVMIPVVLLLLTGGATFATISAPAVSIGTILLLLAGPGAITLLLYAYSR